VYFGDGAQALWNHIKHHYNSADDKIYAHYAAILNSSGMGKSRTIDEMSKAHFVIPINLRGPNTQGMRFPSDVSFVLRHLSFIPGYPPPDHNVREFLTKSDSRITAYQRTCAFMKALFEDVLRVLIEEGLEGEEQPVIASRFRAMMTDGQQFGAPNKFRKDFYDKVIRDTTVILADLQVSSTVPKAQSFSFFEPCSHSIVF